MKNSGNKNILSVVSWGALALTFLPIPLFAGTATIDATTTNQYIRGFGASCAWMGTAYPANQATLFWDATNTTVNGGVTSASGVGMSLLRQRIPSDSGYEAALAETSRKSGIWAAPKSGPLNGRLRPI